MTQVKKIRVVYVRRHLYFITCLAR